MRIIEKNIKHIKKNESIIIKLKLNINKKKRKNILSISIKFRINS